MASHEISGFRSVKTALGLVFAGRSAQSNQPESSPWWKHGDQRNIPMPATSAG